MEKNRCDWSVKTENMREYHDNEWGVPVHDDAKHFEFIVLDSNQAGLSWQTVLNKRDGYREAFANFDPIKISQFTDADVERLMLDSRIIRNRLKIKGTIKNALAFLAVQQEFGSFDKYIWQFVNGKIITNNRKTMKDVPATSPESDSMSKDLKKRGFTFVGSTICYAYMQAAGLVNDHLETCFKNQ